MRFRAAVSTFAALSCMTMIGVATSLVSAEDPATTKDAALTGNQWGVEVSADYGSTWTSTLTAGNAGAFPVQVNLAALADKNFYQPITLRTAVGTKTGATVSLERAQILTGSPEQADAVQIRMAASPRGYCASSLFDTAGPGGQPIAPHRATEAEVPAPVELPAAFPTTAGQPETVCVEFSIARGEVAPPSGEMSLAWPMLAQVAESPAPSPSPTARDREVERSVPSSPTAETPDPGA